VTERAEPAAERGALGGSSARVLQELASRAGIRIAAAVKVYGPIACLYLGLVLLLWLPLGYKNGMPYETGFVWNSESEPFWKAFFYGGDPLRVYTNVFYNTGYHLSAAIGLGGSFIGYQIVYAVLWWARGMLVYLIVVNLFPRRRLIALLAGGIVLVHASDHALNWVGQLNQFGMIFWMLAAFYALVRALKAERQQSIVGWTLIAMFLTRMSLWSYESPLFIILAFPVLVLLVRFRFSRRTMLVSGAFYVIPLIYIWDNYRRYSTSGSTTYQESVLRGSFSPGPLLSDLWFNVVSSLKFTNWGSQMPAVASSGERLALGLGGAALFAVGIAVAGTVFWRRGDDLFSSPRALAVPLVSGLALLVLSFPAYLILTSSRQLWRTQFLSGIGAGLALAALVALIGSALPRPELRIAAAAVLGGVIAYFGVAASFTMASFHYGIWQRHRTAMAEVLGVAPKVKAGTLIVLTGVPKTADPFGDNMWFDVATRLAYPHVPVTGIYFYTDGTPAPHENMALNGGSWNFDNTGFGTLLTKVPFRDTVIIRMSPSGRGTLLHSIPGYVDHNEKRLASLYSPASRILAGMPSAAAERRYEPIPG
jgi:hypothetical protein